MRKQIRLDQASPFVRYIGNREIDEGRQNRWILARDNRLFWCTAGSGSILLEKSALTVEKGQIAFIPAGTPYSFRPASEDMQLFLSVNFDFVYCEALGKYELATMVPSPEAIDGILHHVFSDCPLMNEAFVTACEESTGMLLHQAQKEFFYRKLYYQQDINARIHIVLLRLARQLAAESITKVNRSETIERIIDYIKKHYAEKITVEDVAQHMGYHPDYINRLMHQHTGQTIFHYLQEYRINKAIRLIHSTELPFSAIAEQTGFIDASHFSKTFRKKTGKSPREFREKE